MNINDFKDSPLTVGDTVKIVIQEQASPMVEPEWMLKLGKVEIVTTNEIYIKTKFACNGQDTLVVLDYDKCRRWMEEKRIEKL